MKMNKTGVLERRTLELGCRSVTVGHGRSVAGRLGSWERRNWGVVQVVWSIEGGFIGGPSGNGLEGFQDVRSWPRHSHF